MRAALEGKGIRLFRVDIPRLKCFEGRRRRRPVYAVRDERAAGAWEAYEAVGKEIYNGSKNRYAEIGAVLEQARVDEGRQLRPEGIITATPSSFGRAHGKRSNPDYKQVSLILNTGNRIRAERRLEDRHLQNLDKGIKDLSELVNYLLEQWTVNGDGKYKL